MTFTHYILSEENLIKINEIIRSRLKSKNKNIKPEYVIYRNDNFFYTTKNIKEIIKEENTKLQKIKMIHILIDSLNFLNFKLSFDEFDTIIEIEGDDRDFVFLLLTDLKQYLSSEVNILRRLRNEFLSKNWFLIVSLLMLIGLIYSIYDDLKISKDIIEQITKNKNINEKLNFIIRTNRLLRDFPLGLFAIYFLIFPALIFIRTIFRHFFPANIFLFGKEKESFEKMTKLREKILWGIIIAFTISVITGLIVWLITK